MWMWKPLGFVLALWVGSAQALESCADAVAEGRLGFRVEMPHYEVDAQTNLDLSLLKKIEPLFNTAQTTFGRARVRWLFTHPFTEPQYIRDRQHAAMALAEEALYVDCLAALRRIAAVVGASGKTAWVARLQSEESYPQAFAWLLSGLARAPFALAWQAGNLGDTSSVLGWGALGLALTMGNLIVNEGVRKNLEENYRDLFGEITQLIPKLRATGSPLLLELAQVFEGLENGALQAQLAGVNRKLKNLWRVDSPSVFLRYPLEITTAHSQYTVPIVQRELIAARDQIFALMGAVGELDAFLAMAGHARRAPQFVFPEILSQRFPELTVEDGHHPYWFYRELLKLSEKPSVANSMDLAATHRRGSLALITGPNKGGKSVLLRMLALAPILAQIGAPFPGRVRLTPLQVGTRMRISDDEEAGESTFSEDATRIIELDRRLMTQSEIFQFIVCDEMLRGTHAPESDAMEQVFLEDWTLSGHLVAVATHNLAITELAERFSRLHNYHVDYELKGDTLGFSYRIFPGSAVSTSAFEILGAKGLRPEALARMRAIRQTRQHP